MRSSRASTVPFTNAYTAGLYSPPRDSDLTTALSWKTTSTVVREARPKKIRQKKIAPLRF
eukprot:scaffold253100_cov47-Prasinocladus_malaysianus.AAC.1